MASRMVVPEIALLTISEGESLTVKRRLNSGEERRMIKRGVSYSATGERLIDPIEAGLSKILAYLVDWTLKGPDGRTILIRDQPAAVVEQALDAIDSDSYAEILRAIEAHEQQMDRERDAQKKIRTGGLPSSVTSPSPDAVAGGTTTSSHSTAMSTNSSSTS